MNAKITCMTAALTLSAATAALAAATERQDGSQFLVWAFLGMCALIVIVQLMPVIVIAFGLVKGLVRGKQTPAAEQVAADKQVS